MAFNLRSRYTNAGLDAHASSTNQVSCQGDARRSVVSVQPAFLPMGLVG